MTHHMSNFLAPSLQVAMNELSNHDHSRFLTRTNHCVGRVANLGYEAAENFINKAVLREAVIMQMTWPGAPTIYYGDEAGVCGFTDPDNRRTYPWGQEDLELIRYHKEMIQIHKENKVLTHGSLKFLNSRRHCLSYGRFSADEQIIVVFNNSDGQQEFSIPVWQADIANSDRLIRLIMTDEHGYTKEPLVYDICRGSVTVSMSRTSAMILKCVKTEWPDQEPKERF